MGIGGGENGAANGGSDKIAVAAYDSFGKDEGDEDGVGPGYDLLTAARSKFHLFLRLSHSSSASLSGTFCLDCV